MRNAARAMYPQSSSTAMNANRIMICGRKTSTLPTPLMMPSATQRPQRPGRHRRLDALRRRFRPPSIRSMSGFAHRKIDWNIRNMTARKTSVPQSAVRQDACRAVGEGDRAASAGLVTDGGDRASHPAEPRPGLDRRAPRSPASASRCRAAASLRLRSLAVLADEPLLDVPADVEQQPPREEARAPRRRVPSCSCSRPRSRTPRGKAGPAGDLRRLRRVEHRLRQVREPGAACSPGSARPARRAAPLSFAQSILIPCASAASIMLTATTTGSPRSRSWLVR